MTSVTVCGGFSRRYPPDEVSATVMSFVFCLGLPCPGQPLVFYVLEYLMLKVVVCSDRGCFITDNETRWKAMLIIGIN